MKLDYKLITDIEFDGIDYKDHPDYCDAYVIRATYNGAEMTGEELYHLNNNTDYVYERLMEYLN
jgi:hypothetical protein